ncbi:MAG: DUF4337 domain-containing protein [Anaerolineae bacterium]|nr:DUF4337 domain-containing protein [Anaerolineae bacterium]
MNEAMDRALDMISDQQQTQETFRVRGGFLVAVLAVILAIATLLGNNVEQDVLRLSIATADAYSFFQAKNIRQTSYKLALDQMNFQMAGDTTKLTSAQLELLQSGIRKYTDTINRYESEPDPADPANPLRGEGKVELLAQARNMEQRRDQAMARDDNYDYASVLLQIAIVVMSAAIIVVSRPLLYLSLALAGISILFILNGLFLIVPLPL